jgi:polyhydroxyalkanoate synthesis regulator phasin
LWFLLQLDSLGAVSARRIGKELLVNELISKAFLRGLGLANLTKDAIQKTVEDLAKKSSLSEEEGKRLVKDLHRRSAKAQKRMEKTVETAVNTMLKSLNLAIVRDRAKPAKTGGKVSGRSRRRGSASKAMKH